MKCQAGKQESEPRGLVFQGLELFAPYGRTGQLKGRDCDIRSMPLLGFGDGRATTSTRTGVVPESTNPRRSAAFHDTSIRRCPKWGPRSLIRSRIFLRLLRLVTLTVVPKGKVGCAAVRPLESYTSPFAVVFPSNSSPYQLASPVCASTLGTTNGRGDRLERDDRASDLGDRAINPATAHPITSFLIHPPNIAHPFLWNWPSLKRVVGLGVNGLWWNSNKMSRRETVWPA